MTHSAGFRIFHTIVKRILPILSSLSWQKWVAESHEKYRTAEKDHAGFWRLGSATLGLNGKILSPFRQAAELPKSRSASLSLCVFGGQRARHFIAGKKVRRGKEDRVHDGKETWISW